MKTTAVSPLAVASASLLGATFAVQAQPDGIERPPAIVSPAPATEQVVVFESLSDLASKIRPDAHVYLHRSVQINSAVAEEFNRELQSKHPNWFIVIVEDASRLTYAAQGREFRGVDAVDAFTDTAFRQSSPFALLKDPTTNLPNGAYFVVAKNGADRAMFYSGMAHYDRFVTKEDFERGSVGEPAFRILKADPYGYFEAARAAIGAVEGAVASAERWAALRPFIFGGAVLGLGGLVGGFAHRRARGSKREAEQELATYERALREKTEASLELSRKIQEVFGSVIPTLTHFEGETLVKAGELGKRMRALYTFQKAAEEIVGEARTLIHGSAPVFSSSRYREAVALLTTSKKAFDPESDLKNHMSGERLGFTEALLADVKAFAPWEYSLGDIFTRYAEEAQGALSIMNSIADARAKVSSGSTKLSARLEEVRRNFPADPAGIRMNGLFPMESLTPAALEKLSTTITGLGALAVSDPLRAEGSVGLMESHLDTMITLGDTAAEVLLLTKEIGSFREKLGQELGIDGATIATEGGGNPSTFVEKAEAALRRADHELAQHAHSEAMNAVVEAEGALKEGRALLDTLSALSTEYDRLTEAHSDAIAQRTTSIETVAPLLQELISRYAPNVLMLGDDDTVHPGADPSLVDNISQAKKQLASARDAHDAAQAEYKMGKLSNCIQRWERTDNALGLVDARLAEITEKHARIVEASRVLETESPGLNTSVRDLVLQSERSETARSSQQRTLELVTELDAFNRARQDSPLNPLELCETMKELQERTAIVGRQIRRDWEVHAEAKRSIDRAKQALERYHQDDRRIEADPFTDGEPVKRFREQLPQLGRDLEQLERDLAQPHAEAERIDGVADQICAVLAKAQEVLRQEEQISRDASHEIERAQGALGELRATAQKVRLSPREYFNEVIQESAGRATLERARSAHRDGNHADAQRLAAQAAREAAAEGKRFLDEVKEKRAAEERRRRRAEEARNADATAITIGVTSAILSASRSSSGSRSSIGGGGYRPASSPAASSRPSTSNARRNF